MDGDEKQIGPVISGNVTFDPLSRVLVPRILANRTRGLCWNDRFARCMRSRNVPSRDNGCRPQYVLFLIVKKDMGTEGL